MGNLTMDMAYLNTAKYVTEKAMKREGQFSK